MADSHLQVNHDGSTGTRSTTLWSTSKPEQEVVIKSVFEQNYWAVSSITNISGSHWKVKVACPVKELKINLYISSIRDESRQPDEFKMQLGNTYPSGIEEGWLNLVLGIYVINEEGFPVEYILSGYEISRYDFSTNPSIRGTRTAGLQRAKLFGMYQTEKSVLFRPEFLYYYIESQQNQNFIDSPEQCPDVAAPLQVIFYGAPGTGKSHEVKRITGEFDDSGKDVEKENVFRTTFHPDTDYATFVGCYKPVMKETGQQRKVNGRTEEIEEISYEFVPQAFVDAYIYAYKHTDEPTYLVIEEINRGNCAQIFGDLFQLLDRNATGRSEYTIKPDKDLAKYLAKELYNNEVQADSIKLSLPSNFHILATMNTSDQSLFPMDSAFKRRWDWEYVAISYEEPYSSAFDIDIDGKKYSWIEFIQKVNAKIFDLTKSEDKEMGNFFIKSSIDSKLFKSKVMFYLWNEVLRDEVDNGKYFFYYKDGNEHKAFTFKRLYEPDATDVLKGFMAYLGFKDSEEE